MDSQDTIVFIGKGTFMALFNCSECSKEYSTLAACCPNCGAPNAASAIAIAVKQEAVEGDLKWNWQRIEAGLPPIKSKPLVVFFKIAIGIAILATFLLYSYYRGYYNSNNPLTFFSSNDGGAQKSDLTTNDGHQSSPNQDTQESREDVLALLRTNASEKWKTDYTMVKWEFDKQVEAYDWVMSQTSYPDIVLSAKAKWRPDYNMVKWEYRKQVEAYRGL